MWVKIVAVAAVALLAAPIIITIIKGTVGLVVAAIFAFAATIIVPIAIDAISLGGIKVSKAIVAKNPIEELERQYIEGKEKLRQHYNALEEFKGGVEGLKNDFNTMVAKYPHRRAEFQEGLDRVKASERAKDMAYVKAGRDLESFRLVVEESTMVWNMAVKMAAVEKAAGNNIDPMDEVKRRTALQSVQDAMNTSLASLDMAMLQNQIASFDAEPHMKDVTPEPLKVSYKPTEALPDFSSQKTKTGQPVTIDLKDL